jgi:transcriptional regulator with XRE-family HTH domain
MALGKYRGLFQRAERRVGYWRGAALTEFITDLVRRMEARGLNRAALAKNLKVSMPAVSQALNGDSNLTIASMVKYAMAVDGVLHLHISDRNVRTEWIDHPIESRAPSASGTTAQLDSASHPRRTLSSP